ncbi:MAG: hypothetical protein M3347_11395, partial [Armatimonadota bacterium]|nr:hypothetical protein [Armatimonadota bacterium]
DLGNTSAGVSIGGTNNTIGGTTTGARNLISGNNGDGVSLGSILANNTTVQGNFIGTAANGTTALGNTGNGVTINGASSNTIGGTGTGAGNLIAFNNNGVGVIGVAIISPALGNNILSNSIHSNILLGIDLGADGVTPNDADDSDTGPNNLQNFPDITSVVSSGGSTTINATLTSTPSASFVVQFFVNDACDSSGNGEGKTFIGQATVSTNASGTVSFSPTFSVALVGGHAVTATATGVDGTSEFSACTPVISRGRLQLSAASYSVNESSATATVTITRTGGSNGTVGVPVIVTPGTATRGTDYSVPASGQPAGASITNGTPSGGDTATLTFNDGELVKSFLINIINDTVDETNETINLALGTPTGGATLNAPATATLTIVDNDGPPTGGVTIGINNVTVTEGDSGVVSAVFTLTLSAPSNQTVLVDFTTADVTATANSDYQPRNDTRIFNPGETSKTITVFVNGDTVGEPTETFVVNLSNPSYATINDGQGVGTIVDNDPRPDLLIKQLNEPASAFALNNVYQPAPSGQQVEVIGTDPGVAAVHQIKVENDSSTNRSFLVKATESGAIGFSMTYKVGGSDISAAIVNGGYTTPLLSPGAAVIITLTAIPARNLSPFRIRDSILRVFFNGSDTTVRDAVHARTFVNATADLLLKLQSEAASAFALNNVYQLVPENQQVRVQGTNPGATLIYQVKVENDSPTTRNFVVRATQGSGDGWFIKYRSGPTDITTAVLGSGYTTVSLAPGASEILAVEVTPSSSLPPGRVKDVVLNVFLTGTDSTPRDAVRARSFVHATADLLIKLGSEAPSQFALNNVYQPIPDGPQVRSLSVANDTTAIYQVQVQNDSPNSRNFVVKAMGASGDGWTVRYRSGATDITAAILNAGYTTAVLAPGASEILAVEVTPSSGVPAGSFRDTVLRVFLNSSDATVRDAVRGRTLVP